MYHESFYYSPNVIRKHFSWLEFHKRQSYSLDLKQKLKGHKKYVFKKKKTGSNFFKFFLVLDHRFLYCKKLISVPSNV